mmetsp:Transcript_4916/g.10824  ORF Transcript_4916/g.10824 Transcript_4916/m.10824 type:complete len:641 (+) Transcript_4916:112-2034(+)
MPTASITASDATPSRPPSPIPSAQSVSGNYASSSCGSAPSFPQSVQPPTLPTVINHDVNETGETSDTVPNLKTISSLADKTPAATSTRDVATDARAIIVLDPLTAAAMTTIPARPAISTALPVEPRPPKPLTSKPSNPKPATSKPLTQVPPKQSIPCTAISLETLLNEKRTLLASFEAKFNEKIMSHHKELMDEQRRSLESQKADDGPLMELVTRLQDELEEQKFSHEVELSLEKNKVEKLEEAVQLFRDRGVGLSHPVAQSCDRARKRVKELEEELKREKDQRINQLKSLEQLHFAEFREIEKKHTEFVSHLVASYQKEIQFLKDDMKDKQTVNKSKNTNRKSLSEQRELSEHVEAAAALSSLAAPPMAEEVRSPRSAQTIEGSSAVTVAIQIGPASKKASTSTIPSPHASDEMGGNTKGGRGKKRAAVPSPKQSPILDQRVSEVSDSGSASGDNGDQEMYAPAPEQPRKKTKIITKQKERVEEILRKAGKLPPAKTKPSVNIIPVNKNKPNATPKKKKGTEKKVLSEKAKTYLKAWMMSPKHCDHPYPNAEEKAAIMADTGISYTELNNWFVNNRKRFWQNVVKPQIEEIKKADRMKKMKESYDSCCGKNVSEAARKESILKSLDASRMKKLEESSKQ